MLVSTVTKVNQLQITYAPSFWISFPFRSPQIEFPMLYSRYSLVICSIHGSVSMLIPITSSSRPNPFPLGCCCYSVTQSCPPLCQPMDCSMPGLPVLHHLMELAQTYVHWVSDAIQTFHCLLTPLLMPSIFPSIRDFSNDLALCIR